uniref:Uncharacterized protein n=1 Tax=Theileria annulata TaxID=5874 RepID=A0A3B0MX57_THEAN
MNKNKPSSKSLSAYVDLYFPNVAISLVHSLLVFLSYFINNFLFNCYYLVVSKTFFSLFKCLNNLYTGNLYFLTKWLEYSVSYFVVFTWLRRYSSKFDGYAFHHLFHYRYGIINFKDMISRVLGTLSAASFFGYLYQKYFNVNNNAYNSSLKKTLYKMLESNTCHTLMEWLVYSNFKKSERNSFTRKFLSGLLVLPSLKYEDRYYDLAEKYVALLFEYFVVEFTFSLFLYTLSYLFLRSRTTPKANMMLNTIIRGVFATCGNLFLSKLEGLFYKNNCCSGKVTLDESKSLVLFFEERNVLLLLVRITSSLLAAYLIPLFLPMPSIMCLRSYKDLFPNTSLEGKLYRTDLCGSFYVRNEGDLKGDVSNSKWPESSLGSLFSKLEEYLDKKLSHKKQTDNRIDYRN